MIFNTSSYWRTPGHAARPGWARMSARHPTISVVPSLDEIAWLRANSPAWRLLRADNAPLVLSFLYRVFVADNVRSISATELASRLDDELYALNQRDGEGDGKRFPKSAKRDTSTKVQADRTWANRS